ncbi:MAG: arylsulfatase [Verrucomicrobia bacterium]|nr:arylsulfatase [Verrucomicrobiota bacterium]
MKRLLALIAGLLLGAAAEAQTAAPRPPNFVVIFVDDLGYGDIGPYGATKQRTPNLDRMAAEGMKLTSFYAAPVCSVSRAQLMTGCYGARVSVPGVYFPGGPQGLHPSENTVADLLRPLGYATACVGKWHLGDQPDFLPTRQGFDRYLGIPYSNDMQRAAKGSKTKVSPLVRDDKVAELLTDEQQSGIVARYTEEAVRFMRDSKDRPFFLYFPHTAVHTPIWPGEAFRGKSGNGRFGDWVEEVDWSVGKVLEAIKELGLDENTLVLFTSDNGPWMIKGPDGGSAGPLRGSKGSTWEGGVRVPTVARWPGRIPAGTARSAVAGTIDVLPTLVGLAGGKVPAEPVIDGRDIAPLLTGRTEEASREAHYYFAGYNLQAVRQGRWKLALAAQPAGHGKRKDEGVVSKVPRLYDLEADIGETTDLAEREPAVVERLRSLAAKVGAEIGGNTPQARRGPGVVASPRLLYEVQEDPKPALTALKNGDRLESKDAPQIAGRRIRIEASFSTKQKDAVIVSHGGSAIGYALHLQAGRLRFSVRNGGETFVEAPVAAGETKAVATLEKDGTLSLKIGDAPEVTAKGSKTFPRQPQEDFCVGHDAALAAVPYAGEPVKFKGRLNALTVTAD